jgi:hypothetical protein
MERLIMQLFLTVSSNSSLRKSSLERVSRKDFPRNSSLRKKFPGEIVPFEKVHRLFQFTLSKLYKVYAYFARELFLLRTFSPGNFFFWELFRQGTFSRGLFRGKFFRGTNSQIHSWHVYVRAYNYNTIWIIDMQKMSRFYTKSKSWRYFEWWRNKLYILTGNGLIFNLKVSRLEFPMKDWNIRRRNCYQWYKKAHHSKEPHILD